MLLIKIYQIGSVLLNAFYMDLWKKNWYKMCNFIKKVPVFPKLEKKVADVTYWILEQSWCSCHDLVKTQNIYM